MKKPPVSRELPVPQVLPILREEQLLLLPVVPQPLPVLLLPRAAQQRANAYFSATRGSAFSAELRGAEFSEPPDSASSGLRGFVSSVPQAAEFSVLPAAPTVSSDLRRLQRAFSSPTYGSRRHR